ncbi:MAG: hypothetical protein OXC72_03605 [Roseovarius sp.]|nr:hypothetical protein [Roseovarius sp.]
MRPVDFVCHLPWWISLYVFAAFAWFISVIPNMLGDNKKIQPIIAICELMELQLRFLSNSEIANV